MMKPLKVYLSYVDYNKNYNLNMFFFNGLIIIFLGKKPFWHFLIQYQFMIIKP